MCSRCYTHSRAPPCSSKKTAMPRTLTRGTPRVRQPRLRRLTAAAWWTTFEVRGAGRTRRRRGAHGGKPVRRGERVVNGFHVQAVGWVLVANARVLTPAEARELSDLWTDLMSVRAADLRQDYPLLRWLLPRSLPLSPATRAAVATLVGRMAAQHPERFSDTALRRRRNHWVRQVALGFALSGLAAILVPLAWPGAATVAPTFFLMGGLCVLPAVTLWRAATTVHYCAPHAQVIGQAPRHPLSRVRTR
jgi:hypothetical protein